MSVFPKPYADVVARLRVTCGFILVAAFAWFARPDERSLTWGLPVSALGLLLRAWATGHVEKLSRLGLRDLRGGLGVEPGTLLERPGGEE